MYLVQGIDEKIHGPLDVQEVRQRVENGLIRHDSLVSRGAGRWYPFHAVPELRELLRSYHLGTDEID